MQERKENNFEYDNSQLMTQPKSFLSDVRSQIFISHFKQEFIYELEYICALDAGRGVAPRDSFYSMIAKQMKELASSLPFGDTAISAVDKISAVINMVEEKKRDSHINKIAELGKKFDRKKLEILLDIAAREVFTTFEPIIKKLKDEFVAADFARVGVRRIFEYLSREGNKVSSKFPLDKSILISLIEGRSGFGVDDHRNTQLKLKNNSKISAETIYGRSGFQTIKVKECGLEKLLFIRYRGKHKEGGKLDTLKDVAKGNTESLYDFGYAKPIDKKHKEIPRAGYVVVSQEIIDTYAYYKQATSIDKGDFKPEDRYEKIDPKMKAELVDYTPSILEIDKQTLIKFLSWSKNNDSKSILEYLHDVLKLPSVSYAKFKESLNASEEKIDCTSANFSHIDFSGAKLIGDFSHSKFIDSYLVEACFENVTAHGIDLTNARCEFLKAKNVKFNNATLNLTHFDYAEFNECDFSGCSYIGSTWLNASLKNSVGDNREFFEKEITNIQNNAREKEEEIKATLLELHKDIRDRTQELYEAQKTMLDHIARLTNGQDELNKELRETVEDLFKQKEAYIKFEKFCKNKFKQISNGQAEHSKQIDKIKKQLKFFEKELHKLKDSNEIKDFLKRFKEELSQLTDEVSELKKSSLEVVKKQEQVEIIQKDHDARLANVESIVAGLNKKSDEVKKEEEKKDELLFPEDPEKIELLINQLTKDLKLKYKEKGKVKIILSNRNLNILDFHITLSEAFEKKGQKNEEDDWLKEASIYFEQPYQLTSLNLEDIFETKSCGTTRKILISGAPGTGKTTWCQKVLYEWSVDSTFQEIKSSLSFDPGLESKRPIQPQKTLWSNKFDYVFNIPLRILNDQKDKDLSLEKIILRESGIESKYSEQCAKTISYVINKNKDRCLLILDGADEIAHLLDSKSDNNVQKLIRQVFELNCYLVITTRPYRIEELEKLLDDKIFNMKLENRGFSNAQIKKYILSYFSEEKYSQEKAKTLINFLENNSQIWGSAHIPINLSLICKAWQERKKSDLLFNDEMSITDLYQNISCQYLRYFLEKKENIDVYNFTDEECYNHTKCKNEMRFLQALAFVTLTKRKLFFGKEHIDAAFKLVKASFDSVLKLGLLRTIGVETEGNVQDLECSEYSSKNHHFHHLTFHEFFAARYIKETLEQKDNTDQYNLVREFLLENRYVSCYQVLFGFVAGLLDHENIKRPMQDFWNIILSESLDESLDLTRVGHLRLIIRCLEEAKCHENIPFRDQMLNSISNIIEKMIHDRECYAQCDNQFKRLKIGSKVIHSINFIDYFLNLFASNENIIYKHFTHIFFDMLSSKEIEIIFPKLLTLMKKKSTRRRLAYELAELGEKITSDEIIKFITKRFTGILSDDLIECVIRIASASEKSLTIIKYRLKKISLFPIGSHLDYFFSSEIYFSIRSFISSMKILDHFGEELNKSQINDLLRLVVNVFKCCYVTDSVQAMALKILLGQASKQYINYRIIEETVIQLGTNLGKCILDNLLTHNKNTLVLSKSSAIHFVDLLLKEECYHLQKRIVLFLCNSLLPNIREISIEKLIDACNGKKNLEKIRAAMALTYFHEFSSNTLTSDTLNLVIEIICNSFNNANESCKIDILHSFERIKNVSPAKLQQITETLLLGFKDKSRIVQHHAINAVLSCKKIINSVEISDALLKIYKHVDNWFLRISLCTDESNLSLFDRLVYKIVNESNAYHDAYNSIEMKIDAARAMRALMKPEEGNALVQLMLKPITGDQIYNWESTIQILSSLAQFEPHALEKLLKNILDDLGKWIWYDEAIKNALFNANFSIQTLIRVYLENEHPILPSSIVDKAIKNHIPITLSVTDSLLIKNGVKIHKSTSVELIEPSNPKRWKAQAKKLQDEFDDAISKSHLFDKTYIILKSPTSRFFKLPTKLTEEKKNDAQLKLS